MNKEYKNGLVSVIIPVYNVSEYLSRCLNSVINQSYKNLEIILVDDGSTDDSYTICKKYEEEDSRIRVFHKENGGAASARKLGLLNSCGDYIAMIDADDWIHPDYFNVLVNIQKKSGSQITICQYQTCTDLSETFVDVDANQNIEYKVTNSLHECMEDSYVRSYIWGRIYTRDVIGSKLPQEGIVMGEDTLFNILVMCSYQDISVSIVDMKLYYYYMRDTSVIHTVPYADMIYVSGWLIDNIALFCSSESKREVIKRCMKIILYYAYYQSIGRKGDDKKRLLSISDRQFKQIKPYLKKYLDIKMFVLYTLLYNILPLYRLLRIIEDRSLLVWEKDIKRKRKVGENDI